MTKNAEKNARTMLSRLSTEQLIKEFDMTEDIPITLEWSVVGLWMNWKREIQKLLTNGLILIIQIMNH
nr:MAG TPA: hypothetical protein [Caudoviricetes sp.]